MDESTTIRRLTGCFIDYDIEDSIEQLALLLVEFNLDSFDYIIKIPALLHTFQVDVFWLMHLNGFISFWDYIIEAKEAMIIDFVRQNYLNAAAEDTGSPNNGAYESIPLSICADITLYLFNLMKTTSDRQANSIINRIINGIFLPDILLGTLKPSDIQLFSDILATTSCSAEREALQELQIQQIARLLRYDIELCPIAPRNTFSLHRGDRESPNREAAHSEKSPFYSVDPFYTLASLHLPVDIFLKAFDRLLRTEDPLSPFNHEHWNISMINTTPGVQSVVSVLLESASRDGLSLWKVSPPILLSCGYISRNIPVSDTSRNGFSGKGMAMNNSVVNLSCFPLVEALHLATACAKAGISESSQKLWLRAMCLAEQVTNSLHHAVPSGVTDPGTVLLAEWLDFILGPRTGFPTNLNHGNTDREEEDYMEMQDVYGVELDAMGGRDRGDGECVRGEAVVSVKTLEFACLSLCSCIGSQREATLQVICHALRARRPLSKEAVDIYLHAAREQLGKIDALKAPNVKATSSTVTQTVPLPLDRLISWAGTLRRTGFLPVGVFHACKIAGVQGHKGLMRTMDLLSSSCADVSVRDSCCKIVSAMATSDPPLCSADEAKQFIERGTAQEPMSSVDSFLAGLKISEPTRCYVVEALEVITFIATSVTQRDAISQGILDQILIRWKSACKNLLHPITYSDMQTQHRKVHIQNSSTVPINQSQNGGVSEGASRDIPSSDGDAQTQLKVASVVCSAFFHMLTLISNCYSESEKSSVPHMSSANSGSSSSSSSGVMSALDEPTDAALNVRMFWRSFAQAALSILVGSNSRLVSGVLAAVVADQIRDKASSGLHPSYQQYHTTSHSSSSSDRKSVV